MRKLNGLLIVVLLFLIGCQTAVTEPVEQPTAVATLAPEPTAKPMIEPTVVPEPTEELTIEPTAVPEPISVTSFETAVINIPLTGPLASRSSEISGMAWYGDWLILLPQYPFFNRDGQDGALYALPKADIEAFVNGDSSEPLEPQPILLDSSGLRNKIPGYEGFESIAFVGDDVYLTIEANHRGAMQGYLVRGQIAPDLSGVTVYTQTAVINPQADIDNMTDETILLVGDQVLTMYESNGLQPNPNPIAHIFTADLAESGTIPFPRMEYRVTDATELDENGRFWVISYNFPHDNGVQTDDDPIAAQYGKGATHADNDGVERLVELQYSPDGISMIDAPPVQLQLLDDELRNWEGIVRFNSGWLLATDKYPVTILGYVPSTDE